MAEVAPTGWVPIHSAHSIERAAITAVFTEPITETYFGSEILPEANELAARLKFANREDTFGGLAFQISGGNVEMAPRPPSLTARTFNRMEGTIAVDTLVVQRQMISFSTTRYVRWKHFMEAARQHFMPLVAKTSRIASIGILRCEYFDRFVFQGPPAKAVITELFRDDSPYVAPLAARASTAGQLWHVHTGNFEPAQKGRRLINVNLDAADNPDGNRSVRVHTFAEDQGLAAVFSDLSDIENSLNDLHYRLKSVLQSLITPKLCLAIGLSPPEAN